MFTSNVNETVIHTYTILVGRGNSSVHLILGQGGSFKVNYNIALLVSKYFTVM
jgi:hypothetical protein